MDDIEYQKRLAEYEAEPDVWQIEEIEKWGDDDPRWEDESELYYYYNDLTTRQQEIKELYKDLIRLIGRVEKKHHVLAIASYKAGKWMAKDE